MTGEEMERAIEFLLKNQATLEERVDQTQAQLSELSRIVQMQAESQSQLNEMLTRAVTGLAEGQQRLTEAQTKTETKVDRLAGIVEKLVERLGA